jgi:succinate dehydrogenase / fumarate reductase cytochrome b subunit
VGALASVGLRAAGEHGRVVDMPGLRRIGDTVTASQLTELHVDIAHVDDQGNAIDTTRLGQQPQVYHTLGWLRPKLIHGQAVWAVVWNAEAHAWVPWERKKEQPTGVAKYRRLHALVGALFGLFLIVHLSILATTVSPARFDSAARSLHQWTRQVPGLEAVAVIVPLVILLTGGLHLLIKARLRFNVDKYKRGGRWRYFLQRISALILLVFLLMHVSMFSRFGLHQVYQFTHWRVLDAYAAQGLYDAANPLRSLLQGLYAPLGSTKGTTWQGYASLTVCGLGLMAAVYHLANGLWTGAMIWGLCESNQARQICKWGCNIFGILLLTLASAVVFGCLTAGTAL